MDWSAAIETNREALRRILTALVAMAGLRGRFAPEAQGCPAGGAPTDGEDRDAAAGGGNPAGKRSDGRPTLPRHLHRAVLRLLRPAESAARRLIIVTARDLVVTPQTRKREIPTPPPPRFARSSFGPPASQGRIRGCGRPHVPTLPLFDPLPRWRGQRRTAAAAVPRISFPGYAAPAPIAPRLPPMPDDPIDATRLALRLRAVATALDDLPAHASRFARWRARRDAALHPPPCGEGRREAAGWGACTVAPRPAILRSASVARPGASHGSRPSYGPPQAGAWKDRVWPLRPGRPPGWRAAGRHAHRVHDVLNIVHDLAFWAMERTDTS